MLIQEFSVFLTLQMLTCSSSFLLSPSPSLNTFTDPAELIATTVLSSWGQQYSVIKLR